MGTPVQYTACERTTRTRAYSWAGGHNGAAEAPAAAPRQRGRKDERVGRKRCSDVNGKFITTASRQRQDTLAPPLGAPYQRIHFWASTGAAGGGAGSSTSSKRRCRSCGILCTVHECRRGKGATWTVALAVTLVGAMPPAARLGQVGRKVARKHKDGYGTHRVPRFACP